MRFGSITFALTLGVLGISGCGGGGTATGPSGTVSHDTYDTPPTTYEAPAGPDVTQDTYDAPPPSDDSVPTTDDPAAPAGLDPQFCTKFCQIGPLLDCLGVDADVAASAPTDAQCQAECAAQIDQVSSYPCLGDVVDFLACLVNDPGTCDLLRRAQQDNLSDADEMRLQNLPAACEESLGRYTQCSGNTVTQGDSGGQRKPGSCNGCPNACDACRCTAGNDSAACDSLCTN